MGTCSLCFPNKTVRCGVLGKHETLNTTENETKSSLGHCSAMTLVLFTGMNPIRLFYKNNNNIFTGTSSFSPLYCLSGYFCRNPCKMCSCYGDVNLTAQLLFFAFSHFFCKLHSWISKLHLCTQLDSVLFLSPVYSLASGRHFKQVALPHCQ